MGEEFDGALFGEHEEVMLPYTGINNFKRLSRIGTIEDGAVIRVWDDSEKCDRYYLVKGSSLYFMENGIPINKPLEPTDVLSIDAAPNGWGIESHVAEEDLEGLEGATSEAHPS